MMHLISRFSLTFTLAVAGLFLYISLAEAQPQPCPAPGVGAFTGCYYDNTALLGAPVFVRTDKEINFYWGNSSPDQSLPAFNFSARWQGNFVLSAGVYTFTAITSDGMRIYIDGGVILDRWRDQSPNMYTTSRSISAGNHLIVVEYYEVLGGATAQVSWKNNSPGTQVPVISSFSASPAATTPGQPVSLTWNTVGATSINIDNGVGDVSNRTVVSVSPNATTTYTLTASNGTGSSTALTTVSVTSTGPGDTQPPSVPTLMSAVARSATEVDLAWSASVDNVGVAGYTVYRNGSLLTKIPATALNYADTTVSANSTYVYAVNAYDAAANVSALSNQIRVTTPAATMPGGSCPAPATGAFTGCYYSNMTLSGDPVFIRKDPQINFYWGNESPDNSLAPLNFSARWQGSFAFTQGNYTFTAITSDGMRLYIDGTPVINRWRDQSPNLYTASVSMIAGVHLVVVEYYEHLGGATAQVSWVNNSPAPTGPVISSFTATPPSIAAGQTVTLAWSVAGATSVMMDNGIGDVSSQTSVALSPVINTTYILVASNATGSSTATTTVAVASSPDTQSPTAPSLVSAVANNATEVDLQWTASTDNVGVAGYQISRNGNVLAQVPAAALSYADTTVAANTTYTYTVKAFDAAANYSGSSNGIVVTTPAASAVSVTWYGGCWQTATIYGVTGNYQAIDFALRTTTPVPLQGTLFFAPDCDASYGADNMNDYNALTGNTHMVQGFSHHPNEIPTSAFYWVGPRTVDGKCAPGSPCSMCVNYNRLTPNCDSLP